MEAQAGTVHQPFLYNATEEQLQEFLLLGLFVAGKTAVVQQHKLHWFLELLKNRVFRSEDYNPFQRLGLMEENHLLQLLTYCKVGQYTRLVKALKWLGHKQWELPENQFVYNITRDELCECPGLGMKTASFFLIYTREYQVHACLDTHILKWLGSIGHEGVPSASPTSKKTYEHWEETFLKEADHMGKDPTELDFQIWKHYSTYGNKEEVPVFLSPEQAGNQETRSSSLVSTLEETVPASYPS